METTNKLFYSGTKFFTENEEDYRITVRISLDDDCKNNICDWSITADVDWKNKHGKYEDYLGGCCMMKLQNIFRNWQNSYRCIFVTIMVLLCIRWKMAYITLEEAVCLWQWSICVYQNKNA